MEPPKELEGHRVVGDKRTHRGSDLEMSGPIIEAAVEDLCKAKMYATFGPDELREARNRGYKLAACCR